MEDHDRPRASLPVRRLEWPNAAPTDRDCVGINSSTALLPPAVVMTGKKSTRRAVPPSSFVTGIISCRAAGSGIQEIHDRDSIALLRVIGQLDRPGCHSSTSQRRLRQSERL